MYVLYTHAVNSANEGTLLKQGQHLYRNSTVLQNTVAFILITMKLEKGEENGPLGYTPPFHTHTHTHVHMLSWTLAELMRCLNEWAPAFACLVHTVRDAEKPAWWPDGFSKGHTAWAHSWERPQDNFIFRTYEMSRYITERERESVCECVCVCVCALVSLGAGVLR